MFGKTIRLKDKAKQREERNAENEFLYGRRPGDEAIQGRTRTGRPTMFAGFDGGQTSSKPAAAAGGRGGSSVASASKTPSVLTASYGQSDTIGDSHSTSYYRGDSDEAISARGNHFVEDGVDGSTTSKKHSQSSKKPPPRLSQEEIDKDTKRRLREERRRQRDAAKSNVAASKTMRKSSFEDRLMEGTGYNANENGRNPDDYTNYAQDEEDGYGRKTRHHREAK